MAGELNTIEVALLLALFGPLTIFAANKTADALGMNIEKVFTDSKTGCQYLVSRGPNENLTPRVNGAGRQLGCK